MYYKNGWFVRPNESGHSSESFNKTVISFKPVQRIKTKKKKKKKKKNIRRVKTRVNFTNERATSKLNKRKKKQTNAVYNPPAGSVQTGTTTFRSYFL